MIMILNRNKIKFNFVCVKMYLNRDLGYGHINFPSDRWINFVTTYNLYGY